MPVQPPNHDPWRRRDAAANARQFAELDSVCGLILAALAQVVAWGAYVCLQYTILVVQATAAIPFGSFEVARIDAPMVKLFYTALALVTWLGVRRAAGLLLSRLWIPIAVLALAVMFVWTTALAAPDPRTRISFVGASSGDATFIRTSDDYRILINGTGEPNTLLSHLGAQLPPWDRRLDLVVATHSDDGNLSSLNAVLERYDAGQVLEPPAPARPGVSYEKWREQVSAKGIASNVAGQRMRLSAREAVADLLYSKTNVVLRLSMDGQTFLIAPRLTSEEQSALLASEADLDVNDAALPNEIQKGLIEKMTPETVILFVGRRPDDQPSAETLKLLEGVTVLRTDEQGAVEFTFDKGKR